jgi:hypothetical protein
MADPNQGASIEAEREAFEAYFAAALRKAYPFMPADCVKPKLSKHDNGDYIDLITEHDWKVWQAARRAPPTAAAGEDLPPLPEPDVHDVDGSMLAGNTAFSVRAARQIQREAIAHYQQSRDLEEGLLRLTIEQLKARLASAEARIDEQDAAHYQRKQAALQEIIDIRQEIEAGAAPNVKTWQERANELAVSGRPRGYPDTDELEALKDAEIAELRAQLASEQQAKEYEQRHAAESEIALAKAHAQLAAKGRGNSPEIPDSPTDAAPASAQPAEKVRCKFDGNGCGSVGPYCDKCDLPGAQPDQRESAAEGGSKK